MKNQLQLIINSQTLDKERAFVSALAAELTIDSLTCAAALVYLTESLNQSSQQNSTLVTKQPALKNSGLALKMVRYRLDLGSQHLLDIEILKKVLIEESGVDKNNINVINIQSLYTLIELPDEMPPDIFLHLKSVEINQRPLDIRRVKARNNKKRGNHHLRRNRKRDDSLNSTVSNQPKNNTTD